MKRFEWVVLGVGLLFAVGLGTKSKVCQEANLRYGLGLGTCPDGNLRQTAQVRVSGLRRGAPGDVWVDATAHYTTKAADDVQSIAVPSLANVEMMLVDANQKTTPVTVEDWRVDDARGHGKLTLPDVPDGDYKLHVTYGTRLGDGAVDVAVPLYTPARVHVITDRPLYEPGNVVKFRAVVLRARDLAPLDGRPGSWIVKDPSGEVLLEEKAPAGAWGVIAGTFPIDKGAPTGQWHVAWKSADAIDDVAFTVEPFTLPRFRVEAVAGKAFYRPKDTPSIKGAVVYSSGAPVANAQIEVSWDIGGAWPPPTEWQDKLLPKKAQTAANGRFELALPQIPDDLQGTATLTARIAAIDPAGDRVTGAATVLMSEDGIAASTVTELGDGLVQGFNNRMYVRVTTPDGHVVANTKVNVKRAWLPTDKGIEADLDEDGVASLQIDPGPPVNIVIPPVPYRPAPKQPTVRRGEAQELVAGEGASLADQVELDRWLPLLEPCAKWIDSAETITLGVRVDAAGAIQFASARPSSAQIGKCVVDAVRAKRLPAGGERMLTVPFTFADPELSKLTANVEGAIEPPASVAAQIRELAHGARDCLPQDAGDGALPSMLMWRVREGGKDVELGPWIKDPKVVAPATTTAAEAAAARTRATASEAALACATARFAGAKLSLGLPNGATQEAFGLVRFAVELPPRVTQARPQATTQLGYELLVTTGADATKLRVDPGAVPPLRMRVTPILPKKGDVITAELIRGPDWKGKLPEKLELVDKKGKPVEVKLDDEHKARWTVPADADGWAEIRGGGVRALVFVKPDADLVVSVQPKQSTYRPGQMAELAVRTLVGNRGTQAAVGLFGIDASLGQLVPLPGEGDMQRVQPKVETSAPAFGALDGQALALGRIRGANAAAATVLRVTSTPQPPELDAQVSAEGRSRFDAVEELTDRFYVVLAELHAQARAWESSAPASEKMHPATMAELWTKALVACEARGDIVTDAYGRRLKLALLPEDLLQLTDPRAVIVVGTRLPEDIEPWVEWIQKEKP